MNRLSHFCLQSSIAQFLCFAACAQLPSIRDLPFTQDERHLLEFLRGESNGGAAREAALQAMRSSDVIVVEYQRTDEPTVPILEEAEKKFGVVQPSMDFVEKRKSLDSGPAVATFQLVGSSHSDGARLVKRFTLIGTVFFNYFALDDQDSRYDPAAILSYLESARQSGFFAINAAIARDPDPATLKETLRLQASCIDQLAERLRKDDRVQKTGGYTLETVDRPLYVWKRLQAEPRYKAFSVVRDAPTSGSAWRSGVAVQLCQPSAYVGTFVVATVKPNVAILLRRQGVVVGIWSSADDPILADSNRWAHEALAPIFEFERELGAEPVLIGENGEISKSLKDFQDKMSR